ncbi:MAG: type I methionyl aminopeptidase [Fibrobacteria bacterium]|nr:type I methionyl aminopeptidase [Fibrobacteria bacterium]
MMIKIKSAKEIDLIRKSGHLAATILKAAAEFTHEGVTTNQINELVHNITVQNGAIPAPLNYRGYPKSVCTSVNNVVTHGIPSDYTLKNGDIINIDVTCILEGYHGDTSLTLMIGEVSSQAEELVDITRQSLNAAIDIVRPGAYFGEIGEVIQDIADNYAYGVVREYCGHGIGRYFHEDPLVLHYRSGKKGEKMREGMVFTIEPMINMGSHQTRVLSDGWTVITADGSLSAQFEHTLLITGTGVEILTDFD